MCYRLMVARGGLVFQIWWFCCVLFKIYFVEGFIKSAKPYLKFNVSLQLQMTNENCIYISFWTTLLLRQLNLLEFWSGGYILAVGDNYKELWGHCPYACCREKCSSWDGENSQKKGENVSRYSFWVSILYIFSFGETCS